MGAFRMFTHDSYESAQVALRANKRRGVSTLVTWDAGDGWRGEGYYCPRRDRVIIGTRSLANPNVVIF